jgi:hypothetical protein
MPSDGFVVTPGEESSPTSKLTLEPGSFRSFRVRKKASRAKSFDGQAKRRHRIRNGSELPLLLPVVLPEVRPVKDVLSMLVNLDDGCASDNDKREK